MTPTVDEATPPASRGDARGAIPTAIRRRLRILTPSGAGVDEVHLAAGEGLIYRSATDIGDEDGSAPSTVVRTCRHLGFAGTKTSRSLWRGRASPVAPSELAGEVAPDDGPIEILAKIAAAARGAIDLGLAHVDHGAFTRAVDAIEATNRLLCRGVGTSAPVPAYAANRFLWIGTPPEAPADVHVQHVRATPFEPSGTALVVSHTGSMHETVAAAETAGSATRGSWRSPASVVTSIRQREVQPYLVYGFTRRPEIVGGVAEARSGRSSPSPSTRPAAVRQANDVDARRRGRPANRRPHSDHHFRHLR